MHRRRNAVHAFWKEQAGLVEKILAGQAQPHLFMRRFYDVLGWKEEEYANFVSQRQLDFESSIMARRRNDLAGGEIPPITHRIWLTAPDDPRQPPEQYIDNYFKSVLALPLNVINYFWTNSPEVAISVMEKAFLVGCKNFSIMRLDLFHGQPVFDRITRLVVAQKFVLAADVLKFVVLERFGGIYSDLGIVYDEEVFDLIRLADYVFVVSDSGFFQTSFFGCPPRASLAKIFLAIMNLPSAFDSRYALMGTAPSALDELHIFAGLGLTACAMLFMSPSARALMLPAQSSHMMWISQQSWYGEHGKHGNVLVVETEPTLTDHQEFAKADDIFAECVDVYGDDPMLRAQLRILLSLSSYFGKNPTEFCNNFYFQGSDKALSWHNYGYMYNFLLGRMAGQVSNILEIGIGTDKLDVPSTMGLTGIPGASLRAWRECFPQATIVGADVDVRILFQEPGIETYWVDQTSAAAVQQLFENIGPRIFDLIIDDGLHSFAANRTLMDGAYRHLAADGMYIIEDVMLGDVPAWQAYLAAAGHSAAIVRIPHAHNTSDNCLILIPGRQKAKPAAEGMIVATSSSEH